MPINLEPTIEAILVQEIRGMRADFQAMSRELGELAVQVKSLAGQESEIRDLEKRVTVLETQYTTTEKWVDNARTNSRWLIGLGIGSFLTAVALMINAFFRH